MRNGVAVVGSKAGGVLEIIEDGISGLLFEPGNAADLADKLKLFCVNADARQAVAAAGKAQADEQFTLERHYRDLRRFFKAGQS
jgi:glycosyltransferase involved in cell wall biosynthesis